MVAGVGGSWSYFMFTQEAGREGGREGWALESGLISPVYEEVLTTFSMEPLLLTGGFVHVSAVAMEARGWQIR